MNEYTENEIIAVLNNPNDFPPKKVAEMLIAGCFTIEDLKRNGLASNQANLLEKALLNHKEKDNYERCLAPDVQYEDLVYFLDHYPSSVHFEEISRKKQNMELEKSHYDRLLESLNSETDNANKKSIVENFIEKNPFSPYLGKAKQLIERIEAEEAEMQRKREEDLKRAEAEAVRKRQEEAEREEAENCWRTIISVMADPDHVDDVESLMRLIDEYEQKYTLHSSEIQEKRQEIIKNREAMPQIQAVINDPTSDVINYLHLMKQFPFKKEYLREFMLNDMIVNPSRYDRVEMNWLLKGKYDDIDQIPPVFKKSELMGKNIAPLKVLDHITQHRTDDMDRDPNENGLQPEKNFKSKVNNTDVYFFGCPGSGKSAVLAGLFKADGRDKLRFKLIKHGGHGGYDYASILKNYLNKNLFPQPTKTRFVAKQRLPDTENPFGQSNDAEPIEQVGEFDSDKFIQIVDAELIEKKNNGDEEVHGLSIIEMPGERTLDFAVADPKSPDEKIKLLGEGTHELFMNNNRKVFFFVLDPNPKRSYKMPNSDISIEQKDVLDLLVQFFSNVDGLLDKIDAFHIILAKSDLLRNADDRKCVEEIISKGYDNVLEDIKSLCSPKKSNINAQCDHKPHIFTFSLGKVYPGHMLEYDKEDACKILEVIAANTYSVKTTLSKWESVVEWMNK